MRLRQIALVAKDLAKIEQQLCQLFDVSICYRDPNVGKYGLINALMPFGDAFLEVVSPEKDGTTAGRLLERRGGDGGYMVINQVDSIEGIDERMDTLGVRVVETLEYEGAKARHLHPRDVGAAILSLDEMTPPESWKWAGPNWRDHINEGVVGAIVGVDLQSSDPETLSERWANVLDHEVDTTAAHPTIPLVGSFIRCIPDTDNRGDGVSGIHIQVNNRDKLEANADTLGIPVEDSTLTICGTTIHMV